MIEIVKRRKGKRMERATLLALVAGVLALIVSYSSAAMAQEEVDGRDVYLANCASCHQGAGTGVSGSFPPLRNNENLADTEYVRQTIRDGRTGELVVNGVIYNGEMPAFTDLTDLDVDAVIAYIQGGVFIPAEVGGLEPGDTSRGEDLFTGATRLDRGAPACVSCHTAANFGNLGGTSLGPDLTDLAVRYGGEEGVAAALSAPPSITMTPIFDEKPISDQERADLGAFFDSISNVRTSRGIDWLSIGGVVGALALFLVMRFIPRRQGFARQLRSQR